MTDPGRVLARLSAIVLVGGLALGVCFAALIPGARQIALANHYSATVKSLGELSQPTTVFDSTGASIGKLGIQDREPAELAEVPQILINAVIATEDKTFWTNSGIDVGGVSLEVAGQHLEGHVRRARLDLADGLRPVRGAAVGQVVAVDGGDYRMGQI